MRLPQNLFHCVFSLVLLIQYDFVFGRLLAVLLELVLIQATHIDNVSSV